MNGPTATGNPQCGAPTRRSRAFLIAAALLGGAWAISLACLAVWTANPITLNREQVLRANYVVTARVDDSASGRVTVEREWKRRGINGQITIANLPAASPRNGADYLIPLTARVDDYAVTGLPVPGGAPLIYRATPEALAQLRAILAIKE